VAHVAVDARIVQRIRKYNYIADGCVMRNTRWTFDHASTAQKAKINYVQIHGSEPKKRMQGRGSRVGPKESHPSDKTGYSGFTGPFFPKRKKKKKS
jgi:hypothetical protein